MRKVAWRGGGIGGENGGYGDNGVMKIMAMAASGGMA
jgi:hypothetical protein